MVPAYDFVSPGWRDNERHRPGPVNHEPSKIAEALAPVQNRPVARSRRRWMGRSGWISQAVPRQARTRGTGRLEGRPPPWLCLSTGQPWKSFPAGRTNGSGSVG